MPTYKEALKKLSERKRRPAVARRRKSVGGRPKKKISKRPRPQSRPKSGKKVVKPRRLKKIKSMKRKIIKKRVVRKQKPKKIVKRRKPVKKRKIIRKKPARKPIKKLRRKRKSRGLPAKALAKAGARQRKSVGGKVSRRPRKIIKKKPTKRKVVKRAKPRKKIRRKPVKRKKIVRRRPRRKKPTKPRVYVGKGTLDQLFESQAKVKLLRFFFRSPGVMFQTTEIFKKLRSNTALLRQEMKRLEKLGLIKQKKAWLTFEKKRGGIRKERKIVWHLNPGFDFLNELRDLVLKTAVASKNDLVEKARKIGVIKLLVLTGVFTGDETARADLLIVGSKINQRKLSNFIKDLEAEVGKEINCAVMTIKEFDYRYDMYDRFVRDLLDSNCEILIKKVELW